MLSTDTLGLPSLDTRKLARALAYRTRDDSTTVESSATYPAAEANLVRSNYASDALCIVTPKTTQFSNARLFAYAPHHPENWREYQTQSFDACVLGVSDSPIPAYLVVNSLAACKVEYLTGTLVTSVTVPANPVAASSRHVEWLTEIKTIEAKSGKRRAVSEVFRGLLNLIEEGSYPDVDSILGSVDPKDFSTDV